MFTPEEMQIIEDKILLIQIKQELNERNLGLLKSMLEKMKDCATPHEKLSHADDGITIYDVDELCPRCNQPADEYLLEAVELANRPYGFKTWEAWENEGSDSKKIHMAENTELPGCMSHGDTFTSALKNLRQARVEYIWTLLVDGLPVPEPEI